MIGSPEACLEATQAAARQALQTLERANGLVAIAFIDLSWRYLFNNNLAPVFAAMKEILGNIPILGAYTHGQIFRFSQSVAPLVHNQNIQISLIGEAESS